MKYLFYFVLGVYSVMGLSQVGIGTNTPHKSAVLHLETNNKGLMVPKINLNHSKDLTTISNPLASLLVYNTNDTEIGGKGLYYWTGTQWTFFFNSSNLNSLLGITKFESTQATNTYTVNHFSGETPYSNGSGTTGWTMIDDIDFDIEIDRVDNESVISFTGMLQSNNTEANDFTAGLGIFVDDKLIASKALSVQSSESCSFREFTINGTISDLSIGTHNIKVGVQNRQSYSGGTYSVTYGGNAPDCPNLNSHEGRISTVIFINQPLNF
ncbi:hypothetical protein UJ101_01775 [Flavobacteriaceae bacterium UJ101]|nr:hypothetical protein UJ101_01775 [Flavobacteriaceae bacterium UJ101]